MNRVTILGVLALFITAFISAQAFAEELSNAELSERIKNLEEKASGFTSGGNIDFSGVIEFEAGYESSEDSSSDFSTATIDLGAQGKVNDYITGSFVFTYNEDDGGIELDEAMISINSDNSPFYANLGYYALPFGVYNTRFLADPLTLEIGETTENNITAGYSVDMFELSASVFNGDVNEDGEDDDYISKYVLSGSINAPENEVFSLSAGGSLISDIADSDGIQDVVDDTTKDFTMGWSVFVSAGFYNKIFFDAEYTAASDEIESAGTKLKPEAYNIEVGAAITDEIEAAARYESGEDLETESRYGAVVSYSILDNTSLTGEYLRTEYEDDSIDETDSFTAQLAVEF